MGCTVLLCAIGSGELALRQGNVRKPRPETGFGDSTLTCVWGNVRAVLHTLHPLRTA